MGKASRRKHQQRAGGHRDRVRAAASVPAPNVEGAAVEAVRHAIAMVTSAHASPQDLPGLTGDLAADRARQGLVACALEDYVGALMGQRLASEPLLLARAAEALRRGTVSLPSDCAAEFGELGGSVRLQGLAAQAWDDMDAGDQRLLVLALVDSVSADPDGETAAGRVHVSWRF